MPWSNLEPILIPKDPAEDDPAPTEAESELLSDIIGGMPGTIGALLDEPEAACGILNLSPTSRSLSVSCSADPGNGCTTN